MKVEPFELAVGTSSETLASMGIGFTRQLISAAQSSDASPEVRQDWLTLAAWLGQAGDDLTKEQEAQLAKGWTQFFGLGEAPSFALQPVFDSYAKEVLEKPKVCPPGRVIRVFQRMLATDEEIREKSAHDFREADKAFERISKALKKANPPMLPVGWSARKIVFWSLAWAVTVFGYAWLFDPFGVGGWDYLEVENMNRLKVISLLPLVTVASVAVYRRWVR